MCSLDRATRQPNTTVEITKCDLFRQCVNVNDSVTMVTTESIIKINEVSRASTHDFVAEVQLIIGNTNQAETARQTGEEAKRTN